MFQYPQIFVKINAKPGTVFHTAPKTKMTMEKSTVSKNVSPIRSAVFSYVMLVFGGVNQNGISHWPGENPYHFTPSSMRVGSRHHHESWNLLLFQFHDILSKGIVYKHPNSF